ncbi:MAG TPA: hypothetical protein VFF30_18290 [Nitrososphaerales archaeon]|nr:hypothetical protein [Nitrososphaerales archaeon]
MPSMRGKISVSDALGLVMSGSEARAEERQFPIIDLLLILDILSTLCLHADLKYQELIKWLRCKPSRTTLRRYLDILDDLGFISKSKSDYRGAVKTKVAFQITQKGKALVLVMNQ